MRPLRPRKKPLLATLLAALACFAVFIWLMTRQGGPYASDYALQDACFMVGLVFSGIGLFRVAASSGLFDMISYGYNRIIASFKSADKSDEDKRESFFDYSQNKARGIRTEQLLVGLGFWAVSLALRLFM